MAVRSTEDQASFLLSRKVAEARQRGVMAPDVEAIALFESIALNLLLNPRSALLFALLARNGLRKVVQDELDAIVEIRSAIQDLNNISLSVRETTQLKSARTALLQLEQLDRISADSNQFKKFDKSISEFLNKVVSKSVKKTGATSLTRPSTEAATDLTTSFSNLLDLHVDILDRLYALVVGVKNFLSSPLATIIGLTTASRARADVEDLINSIEETGSLPADRDMVIRLLTNRASIKVIGSLPSITDPVLDTAKQLPIGYILKGRSDPTAASIISSAGPYTLPVSAQLTMIVNGVSVGPFNIPQTTTDLHNKAAVVSAVATYPVTILANSYLFIVVNGISYKVGPLTTGSQTLSSIITNLNTLFTGIVPLSGLLHAVEFINAGTSRLLIFHDTATQISIVSFHTGIDPSVPPPAGGAAVTYDGTVYTNNINALVGFTGTEIGKSGTTPTQFIVDSLTRLYSSITSVSATQGQRVTVSTLATVPGTTLTIAAPTILGLAGTYVASSASFKLYGPVNGIVTDPVSPIDRVDIGDRVTTPSGTSTVQAITADRIQLTSSLATFDGNITIDSALVLAYTALENLINTFLGPWLKGPFAIDLENLNLAISSLGVNSPQAQRSTVLNALNDLEGKLLDLRTKLDDSSTVLGDSSAQAERAIVDGITTSLAERKFDKALDLFLKCKIQEALDSTADTASFGGSFIKASSDFAKTDLVIPNRAIDEQVEGTSSQDIKGL
jgi:hypothetical protein